MHSRTGYESRLLRCECCSCCRISNHLSKPESGGACEVLAAFSSSPTPQLAQALVMLMEEMFQQKAIAPMEKAFGNVKNTANMIGNTVSQIGQGNVVGAYNASRNKTPVMPATTVTEPAPDWNFQSHIN
jgi:hypothetical protein